MAPSSRLSLVSPIRLWLLLNGLLAAVTVSSWLSDYRAAGAENKRLIESQALTLTKSRYDDLRNRRFRDFVEGVGREFSDLHVSVNIGADHFQFGEFPKNGHCSTLNSPLDRPARSEEAVITMCRPFQFSSSRLMVMLSVFFVVSGLGYALTRRLERRATATLVGFLRDSGVHIEDGRDLLGIMSDMREIRLRLDQAKRNEYALIDARARAELAEQVAHDIRSPLAALEAASSGAYRAPTEKDDVIREAVVRMREVAENLLEPRRAGPTLHAQRALRADISAVIVAVLAEKQAASSRSLEFETSDSAPPGSIVRADAGDLKRILSNLLQNAIEATNERGCVTLTLAAGADKAVILSIRDDGIGISPAILPKLGQRGATFGKKGGTGLGLYHARTTVASWGGRLEIESEADKGTTVMIILPGVEPQPPRTPDSPSKAVLIDDDPLVRMNWAMAARMAGKALNVYPDAKSFMEDAGLLPHDTPIYIDSDLGDEAKGEEVARDLSDLGFTELRLATGHDPATFPPLPHIREIQGKEPPWPTA